MRSVIFLLIVVTGVVVSLNANAELPSGISESALESHMISKLHNGHFSNPGCKRGSSITFKSYEHVGGNRYKIYASYYCKGGWTLMGPMSNTGDMTIYIKKDDWGDWEVSKYDVYSPNGKYMTTY